MASGAPIHGEFSSADASGLTEANARFTLYASPGATALTLDSNDVVTITDVSITNTSGGALTVQIYDGANNAVGAGELVLFARVAAAGNVLHRFGTPHACQKGTYPKVITSGAGQIDCSLKGSILRSGS